ncbi:hypothetical protein [Butyrivibrio sp. VCD2006]|uniref:hypothetical protein n=1 Tax=Butyrivibrio sp. VCD2006 TaxID=1280664 RepID=UPI000422E4F5|nr:hypothetical protein [Butyrivibrio sp. VCD2006]
MLSILSGCLNILADGVLVGQQIGQVEVIRLILGTFEKFEQTFSVRDGRRCEQTKPLKIIQEQAQISFLRTQIKA